MIYRGVPLLTANANPGLEERYRCCTATTSGGGGLVGGGVGLLSDDEDNSRGVAKAGNARF